MWVNILIFIVVISIVTYFWGIYDKNLQEQKSKRLLMQKLEEDHKTVTSYLLSSSYFFALSQIKNYYRSVTEIKINGEKCISAENYSSSGERIEYIWVFGEKIISSFEGITGIINKKEVCLNVIISGTPEAIKDLINQLKTDGMVLNLSQAVNRFCWFNSAKNVEAFLDRNNNGDWVLQLTTLDRMILRHDISELQKNQSYLLR